MSVGYENIHDELGVGFMMGNQGFCSGEEKNIKSFAENNNHEQMSG